MQLCWSVEPWMNITGNLLRHVVSLPWSLFTSFHRKILNQNKESFRIFPRFLAPVWMATANSWLILTTGWILMIIRWRLNDTRCRDDNFPFSLTLDVFLFVFKSLRFFMLIKYSQSDEMSNKKHSSWKRESTSVVNEQILIFVMSWVKSYRKNEFINSVDWWWCHWMFWLLLVLSTDIKAEFKVAWIFLWCWITWWNLRASRIIVVNFFRDSSIKFT